MQNKELTIEGFYQGVDREKLFDYLSNQEHLTLVASESCPPFLDEQVNQLATTRRVKPSVVWQELIEAGARELMTKWKKNPATNVGKALDRIHTADKMYSMLYGMVRAYDSHSSGVFTGNQAFIILQSAPYINDWEDEDEAYIDNFAGEWGLDFGDFCFLCAAVAGKRAGLHVLYQEELSRAEQYLREKVWFVDALIKQAQNPLPKSVLEEATDLLYSARSRN